MATFQKKRKNEAVGRSHGGLTTKVHAVCDGLGNPLHFVLTGGQVHDSKVAIPLLETFELKDKTVLCDKGYDSKKLVEYILSRGGIPVIPTKKNSKKPRIIDAHLYKERHLVENLFLKMKNYRRFATRYEKSANAFSSLTCLAAILLWILWIL